MANTLLTPSIIAKEALALLRSNTVYKDLVHTDYSQEFVPRVGDTVNIRKRASLSANDYNGSTITKQNLTETSIPVVLDKFKDVSVAITSKEWSLELVDFSQQVIEPAMIAIGEQVDKDIVNKIFEEAGNTVTRTALSPDDISDIADIAKALDDNKAPTRMRSFVLSTDHNYKYSLTDNLLKASYAGDNQALREADLGRIYRMETYMDQNNPASTATTSGTAIGTFTVKTGSTADEVALGSLSAATATVKTGDGFVYDGVLYRFTEDGTGSSSAIASIATSPVFPAGVTTAVEVPMVRNTASLAFHKDAVAFVNRPLEIPQGAVKSAVASADGLSVRVIFDYDMDLKSDIISFDILYGVKELRSEHIVRLVDGTLS